jgi:hypothetical protein
VLREHGPVPLRTELVEKPRRSLDVSEEKVTVPRGSSRTARVYDHPAPIPRFRIATSVAT